MRLILSILNVNDEAKSIVFLSRYGRHIFDSQESHFKYLLLLYTFKPFGILEIDALLMNAEGMAYRLAFTLFSIMWITIGMNIGNINYPHLSGN